MGAGVVVLKKFKDEYKVLCLYKENKKGIRKYDLTKGKIDKNESSFQAAVRETYEEAGVKNLKFEWGDVSFHRDSITMFIAVTDDNPLILKNPESGIYEHDGCEWNSFDVSYILLPEFLKPFVTWAKKIVEGGRHVKIQST
tara:strand:+ start:459 stop:881 length:423 start_codon:yes stop_codon:yes gene_type:complete